MLFLESLVASSDSNSVVSKERRVREFRLRNDTVLKLATSSAGFNFQILVCEVSLSAQVLEKQERSHSFLVDSGLH